MTTELQSTAQTPRYLTRRQSLAAMAFSLVWLAIFTWAWVTL